MENKKQKKHPNLNHGKQNNQKMKPYLVMQYLLKHSDEDNVVLTCDIVDYLREDCGIYAERRSIYRDVDEINKAMLMIENKIDIKEATKWLEEDECNEEKFIVYDKSKKGFYTRRRNYDIYDIRLLAECIYTAKFLDKTQSERLAEIVCSHVSKHQAKSIKHNVFFTDRVKTDNSAVIKNIIEINEAMRKKLDGKPHTPEKISFKYLKHTINDIKQQVERRHGEKYVVSPFALIINDGNYYLLAFDDKNKKFFNYRVDRMRDVASTGIPREGEEEFLKIDLNPYTQKVFSMYRGEEKRVTLQFINKLLDTAIDRFGKKDVLYLKNDNRHFTITTKVEISRQFFGWLLGLGNEVRIISPPEVKKEFAEYIDKIRTMYEDE